MIWQRFSSWSFADKRKLQSPLQFSAALRGPSWTKGSCSRRCSSPRPTVSSVDKCVAVAVLRGPSWPFVALRGQKEVAVAVAVLRGPPCPPWTNVLPLQFSAALRGPSWTKGSCSRRCSSPRPSVSSVDKCAAVAVLRGPPCPPWTNVLPLQFFAALRVLRGQMCCRCSSSRPSVALRGKRFPPRPSRTDQIMTLHISVQTNVSEPWLPRRYAAFHYPLSPTPYPLPFLPLRLVCDPASPLEDRGRFLRRTRGCGTVQPVWAVIHLVRVTGLIPSPRTT